MAGNRREVKVLITGDAKQLVKEIGTAEGRLKGMSAGMKGLFAGVSVAAIGRGVMSIANDFQDAAISANDFATASGLSVEAASRWQEVAGDIGVESKTLESAMGRLAKTLGKDADAFKKYGLRIERADDGTIDMNGTLKEALEVLRKLEDPTLRAAAGAEMFGKSWADLAPLIETDAYALQDALNAVGDAQVIDEAEVEKAKRMRETMDTLNDSVGGLKYELAEGLIPVISTFAQWLGTLDPKMVGLAVSIGAVVLVVGKLSSAIMGVSSVLTLFAAHPVFVATAVLIGAIALIVLNWDKVTAAIGRAIAKVDEFQRKVSGPLASAYQKVNNMLGGDFGKGSAQLNTSNPWVQQVLGKPKALGGHVNSGTAYPVGERGPELFVPQSAGEIVPNHAVGGGPVVINLYPPAGMDTRTLARDIKREGDRAMRAKGLAVL